MPTFIAAIEPAGRGRAARRIIMDDTTERLAAPAAVKTLGLAIGDSYGADELECALAAVEPALCRERALSLLGYRERTARDLTRRLIDAGFPRDVAATTVTSLEGVGLVDNARFAEMFARSRVSAGFGSRRIRRELAERGVDAEAAESALLAALDDTDDLERARALVGSPPPTDRKARERLYRRLLSKGYDTSVAARALDASDLLNSDDSGSSEE